MTLPEIVLWQELRGRRLNGLTFRRQHAIGPYILDFFCSSAQLAIEVDSAIHGDPKQVARDKRRDTWLKQRGIRVIRVAAADILKDERLEGVLAMIVDAAAPSGSLRSPPPPLRGGGSNAR